MLDPIAVSLQPDKSKVINSAPYAPDTFPIRLKLWPNSHNCSSIHLLGIEKIAFQPCFPHILSSYCSRSLDLHGSKPWDKVHMKGLWRYRCVQEGQYHILHHLLLAPSVQSWQQFPTMSGIQPWYLSRREIEGLWPHRLGLCLFVPSLSCPLPNFAHTQVRISYRALELLRMHPMLEQAFISNKPSWKHLLGDSQESDNQLPNPLKPLSPHLD